MISNLIHVLFQSLNSSSLLNKRYLDFQTFYNRCLLEETQLSADKKDLSTGNITDLVCKKPIGFVPNYVLLRLWRVVYWTSQLLTWLVLEVFLQWKKTELLIENVNAFLHLLRVLPKKYFKYRYWQQSYYFLLVQFPLYNHSFD